MIKCPFCQFENEEGALFCEHCKSDLGVTEPAAAQPAEVTPAREAAQGSAGPNGIVSAGTNPLAAVAVVEAAINEAVPVAQLDTGVVAPADAPIAVAVPLPETPSHTLAPGV